MKMLAVSVPLGLLLGCGGGQTPTQDAALVTPAEVAQPAAPSTPPEASPPAPALDNKGALALQIMGEQDLGDWSVRMGYDLGVLRMLVLTRPADANAVTVAQLTSEAPGVGDDAMASVFSGGEVAAPHPFGLLGYDHVVPRASDTLTARGRDLPRLGFSWLRVDPDTGERESGRGTAIWMHCEAKAADAGPIDGRWLVVASETLGTEHDDEPVSAVAGRLRLCAD